MSRDTIICFRTSEDVRKALGRVSASERRSLSSTIENILYAYMEQRASRGPGAEKRAYPRRKVAAPALVAGPDGTLHAAMVHDLSAGGILLSAPGDFPCEVRDDFTVSVVFTLPETDRPLTMQCIPRHVRSNGHTDIGGSFVDTDSECCRTLRSWLKD